MNSELNGTVKAEDILQEPKQDEGQEINTQITEQTIQQGIGQLTETVQCPGNLVGKLIGKSGETISIIQGYSQAKVQVHHKESGDPKKVSITGTSEQNEKAKEIIEQVLYQERNLSDEKRQVDCPAELVGKVIGKAGDTIKALQIASGARIHVNQEGFAEGQPRKINVQGRLDDVEIAVKMIDELINSENVTVQAVINNNAKIVKLTEKCHKQFVGKIIGKGGANIKEMNRKTRARIQIEQNTEPCIITIQGPQKAAQQAQQEIREIIQSLQQPVQGNFMAQTYSAFPQQAYGMSQQMAPYMGQPAMQSMGGPYSSYYQQPNMQQQYPQFSQSYSSYTGGSYSGGNGGGGGSQGGGSTWQELKDQTGKLYYYNRVTQQSQWERPVDFA